MRLRAPLLLLFLLAACGTLPQPETGADGPPVVPIALVARGWHTDVAVPRESLGPELAPLARDLPGATWLVFGFGERAWLLTRDHSVLDMASALLPGPGALLVTALAAPPEAAFGPGQVQPLRIPEAGLARLRGYLRASLEAEAPIADGPYAGSRFYASPVRYSGVFTCNTWTAEALRQAGMPITPEGVLFASQVRGQAEAVAAQR